MKPADRSTVVENGVTDVTEAMIGYDGLSPADGERVKNPDTRWSEINADLPETEILVLGPPPSSGSRDAFVEQDMSEDAMPPGGHLEERGMVPLPDDPRAKTPHAVVNGGSMDPRS